MSDLPAPSKKIKINEKTIIVYKAPFVNGLQRSMRQVDARKEIPKFYEKYNLSDDVEMYVHAHLYPSLISCSSGKLPTEEEFLALSDEEETKWEDAATELNPNWFPNGQVGKGADEKNA